MHVTVTDKDGARAQRTIQPMFSPVFGTRDFAFAGMVPRANVTHVTERSPALDKLLPGDVITSLTVGTSSDVTTHPSAETLMKRLDTAGREGSSVAIGVLRDGQAKELDPITPNIKVDKDRYGLGVGLGLDEAHAVVGAVMKDTPAAQAGIPQGAAITAVAGQPVQSWHDVHRALTRAEPDRPISVAYDAHGATRTAELTLPRAELEKLRSYRYTAVPIMAGAFREYTVERHTDNPLTAAAWGVEETRDLIFQFYLTIQRMVQRSVPASNMMGPLGIVQAGSKFAYKGNDWLIWFLSMISANLAVVNFLPIPIVDGGLFLFLIIEKLQGRPLSPRTQSIAQVVGLALILSVFIFVTYQDIMR